MIICISIIIVMIVIIGIASDATGIVCQRAY